MRYKNFIILAVMVLSPFFYGSTTGFASILNTADNFAVLAGSTVTNTGQSTITGDIGVWPGTALHGLWYCHANRVRIPGRDCDWGLGNR